MTDKDNVILFPKLKRKKGPKRTKVQKQAIADSLTQDLIDNVSTDIIEFIIEDLQRSGVDMTPNKKDIGLLIEATKALVSRHYEQAHFLHDLTNYIFSESADGVYVNTKVHFNFTSTQTKA
jgi:hypothetical protein